MPALNVFKQENNLIQIIKLSKSSTWPLTVGGYAENLNNLISKPSLISLPELNLKLKLNYPDFLNSVWICFYFVLFFLGSWCYLAVASRKYNSTTGREKKHSRACTIPQPSLLFSYSFVNRHERDRRFQMSVDPEYMHLICSQLDQLHLSFYHCFL